MCVLAQRLKLKVIDGAIGSHCVKILMLQKTMGQLRKSVFSEVKKLSVIETRWQSNKDSSQQNDE